MWKKRFLPYSLDDKKAVSQKTQHDSLVEPGSSEAQDKQLPSPSAACNVTNKVKSIQSSPTVAPLPGPYWTQVPVTQHVVPTTTMYANPINHMNRQQLIVHDIEMERARKAYEMHQYLSMYGLYNYPRAPAPPMNLTTKDMMDERELHERYIQQAREMKSPDVKTEQKQYWKQSLASNVKTEGGSDTMKDVKGKNVTITDPMTNGTMLRRNSYKAVMKNGELVESQTGHLIVTHNISFNNNQEYVGSECPLDLSMKTGLSQTNANHYEIDFANNSPQPNQDNNRCINQVREIPKLLGTSKSEKKSTIEISPAVAKMTKVLPKIAPKPSSVNAIQPKDEVLGEDAEDSAVAVTDTVAISKDDIKKLFPFLKTTNTGSLVLWNFLWAILQDEKHKMIMTWISFSDLQFRIVNPSMLANLWGKVKQNPTMDWGKIKKILDLYQRKNLISIGPTDMEFTFLIVPRNVKEALGSGI